MTRFYLTYPQAFKIGQLIQKEEMKKRRAARQKAKLQKLLFNILGVAGFIAFYLLINYISILIDRI